MKKNNHTQQDLAKLLNLSRQSLNLKLNKKIDFKSNEIAKLAEIYNVDVNYFFK